MNKTMYFKSLGLAVMIMLMLIPNDSFAQRRGGRVVVRQRRRAAVIVDLPREHERVVVGGREFFYSRGVYYRTGPHGYVTIAAPLGARVRMLPAGYTTVTIGGGPFFFYYGTYYRFDPVAKEYIVVNPAEKQEPVPPQTMDRLELIDGMTLEGTFIGGTKSVVQFDTSGVIQEYPIEQIVSLTFAPPQQ